MKLNFWVIWKLNFNLLKNKCFDTFCICNPVKCLNCILPLDSNCFVFIILNTNTMSRSPRPIQVCISSCVFTLLNFYFLYNVALVLFYTLQQFHRVALHTALLTLHTCTMLQGWKLYMHATSFYGLIYCSIHYRKQLSEISTLVIKNRWFFLIIRFFMFSSFDL